MNFLEKYNAIRELLISNLYDDVTIRYPIMMARHKPSRQRIRICVFDENYEIKNDYTELNIKEYLNRIEKLKVFE